MCPLTVCNFPLLQLWTFDHSVDFQTFWIFLYYEYYMSHIETNISPGWENFGVTPKSYRISPGVKSFSLKLKLHPWLSIWISPNVFLQIAEMWNMGIYLFKVNNTNSRERHEICSGLTITIKTPEQCQWCHCDAFIVNFEQILHFIIAFLSCISSK